MGTVFISYRHRDVSGHSGHLCDTLLDEFDIGNVFLDIDSIGQEQTSR